MSGVVEKALGCLGMGFDIACDFRAKYCKGEERMVGINETDRRELIVPGFGAIGDVSVDIKCDKGERIRFQPGVLEFDRMSELFNQRSSLAGRIPSGLFNSMFGFNGSSWAEDATETKSLAMDGYFISLFNLRIDRQPLTLSDHVINAVPSSWDPAALARFIANFGTHVIVGLSVGGQDVVYVRQEQSSKLTPSQLKQHLDKLGDQLFTGTCTFPPLHWKTKEPKIKFPMAFNVFDPRPTVVGGFTTVSCKDGVTVLCSKRGGDASACTHCEWLQTVPTAPDVINFTFVPITSFLKGIAGTGFLSHAINLYLRYKPPISDLQYFLDFQFHRAWAPMLNEHPLGPSSNRPMSAPTLNFNLTGPKLHVNTTQVTVGRTPITGIRLHLEGKKNDRLGVHLQHLSNIPAFIGNQLEKATFWLGSDAATTDEGYYEPVLRKRFSHVCTAPVEYEPNLSSTDPPRSAFIVTGAQLLVKDHGSTTVLHLKLLFSEVSDCVVGHSKWERPGRSAGKSGFLSTISTTFSSNLDREKQQQQQQQQTRVINVDSGIFDRGPPVPMQTQKLMRFVDTSQVCMGPQDSPGFWLVTGAKLDLEKGKIGLHVKFSLLTNLLTLDYKMYSN